MFTCLPPPESSGSIPWKRSGPLLDDGFGPIRAELMLSVRFYRTLAFASLLGLKMAEWETVIANGGGLGLS